MATQEGSGTSTMDLPRIEAIFDSIDQDGGEFAPGVVAPAPQPPEPARAAASTATCRDERGL